jgi:DNA-binding LacI/PurR family transcriptional regulator
MLAERPEVTAIVSANNLMSLGVLQALGTSAHRIAMVGFDDPFWAETVDPALTVVAQPTRTMAERAVELLFERMSGQREEPVREIFDVELRVRDSCGTAAPGAWRT